ncbi:hypothetical protein [Acaryochloris sp. CCMEE 5410]|uniref:hypothetical protein n=1 Tax=Acaryochloris sp. CCMEE 5410 TaxID=310037 RepID=UPI00024842D9|nr:hypothetical protein [Acaryochloris sp. CCMEE 5410]KAI9134075.1 hypothetical protein ON05_012820 [Acaryochloris sp. CCMEE 5410]
MQPSLKKQLLWVTAACILLTLGFGFALSVAVNLSLQGFEQQRPDLEILPSESAPSAAPL